MSKKILIICYTFPPNNEIGGRRWAKFAKELVKLGHDVRVVTFNDKNNATYSNWEKDIETYKQKIISLPSKYPKWLLKEKTWLDKKKFRLAKEWVKLFVKGNFYDRAIFLEKTIQKQLDIAIKEGYNNIIVSCAPFKLSYFVAKQISLHPKVNFIVDFRDPWTANINSYGLYGMGKKRIAEEIEMEFQVVMSYTKIIVLAQEQADYYIEKHGVDASKFSIITNGFDDDDLKTISTNNTLKINSNRIKLCFIGTFLDNTTPLLAEFCEIVNSKRTPIEFHFFGTIPNNASYLFSSYPDTLFFHGKVPLNEVNGIISMCDFGAIFYRDDLAYGFYTKFFEYLCQQKKMIIFSKKGATTGSYVAMHSIGYNAIKGNMEQALNELIESYNNNDLSYPQEFDIQKFNVITLSQKLDQIII